MLRLSHLPAVPVDHQGWRLGSEMDRGKRDGPSVLCHAVLSGGYERLTVLHHR